MYRLETLLQLPRVKDKPTRTIAYIPALFAAVLLLVAAQTPAEAQLLRFSGTTPLLTFAPALETLPDGTRGQGYPPGTLSLTLESLELDLEDDVEFESMTMDIYLNSPEPERMVDDNNLVQRGNAVQVGSDPVFPSARVDGEAIRISLRRTAPAAFNPGGSGANGVYEYRGDNRLLTNRVLHQESSTLRSVVSESGQILQASLSVCIGDMTVCPEPNDTNNDLMPPSTIVSSVAVETNEAPSSPSDVLRFNSNLGEPLTTAMIETLLDITEISIALSDFIELPDESTVSIALFDGGGDNSALLVFPLRVGDQVLPVVSNPAVNAVAGDTRTMLSWVTATDRTGIEGASQPVDDLRSLRYEVTLSEGANELFTFTLFGRSEDGGDVYTLDGEAVSFTLDRSVMPGMTVLLPGKIYDVVMRVRDAAGNYATQDYRGEIRTTSRLSDINDDAIHDELDGVVGAAGGVSQYCTEDNTNSDDLYADSDDDGVPNNIEVRIGTDCRASIGAAANDFVGATRPGIVISTATATQLGGEDYFIRPGRGLLTRVSVAGVTCAACTTLRAYENTAGTQGCASNPGRAGNEESVCPPLGAEEDADTDSGLLLRSFSREVVWVGRDANGNWVMATQKFYVQPSVGFDVNSVIINADDPADASVFVPLSVSVSEDILAEAANTFSVGQVTVSAGDDSEDFTFVTFGQNELIKSIDVSSLLDSSSLTLSISGTPAAGSNLVPAALAPTRFFTLGNASVQVLARTTPSASVPQFTFTSPSPFIDDSASGLAAFRINSEPASSPTYEVTAAVINSEATTNLITMAVMFAPGVDTALNFQGDVMLEAGDLIEVTAMGTTMGATFTGSFFVTVVEDAASDTDNDGVPNSPSGTDTQSDRRRVQIPGADPVYLAVSSVVDAADDVPAAVLGAYALSESLVSDDYSVVISPDGSSTQVSTATAIASLPGYTSDTGVFDFSVRNVGVGNVMSAVIPLLQETPAGALLFKYDEGGWSRFTSMDADQYYGAKAPCPAINAPRGDGDDFGEWRTAGESGMQEGDACLLIEITDGGINDADGTRNGIVHDPNAFAVGRRIGGAGGAMDWIWLLVMLGGLLSLQCAARSRRN